jgi:hypothetical protein
VSFQKTIVRLLSPVKQKHFTIERLAWTQRNAKPGLFCATAKPTILILILHNNLWVTHPLSLHRILIFSSGNTIQIFLQINLLITIVMRIRPLRGLKNRSCFGKYWPWSAAKYWKPSPSRYALGALVSQHHTRTFVLSVVFQYFAFAHCAIISLNTNHIISSI